MHIEPGVVEGAKLAISYASAAGVIGYAAKLSLDTIKQEGLSALVARSAITTVLVFSFFQIFPHAPVGVSEVHLILGATLYLMFGAGPAAIGLAMGLLAQGVFFAQADLPQYGMNVTTLLAPLFAAALVARRVIPKDTAYKDVSYAQAFKLSAAFQGGVVAWVAFWAVYGQGFGFENLSQIATFAAAYAAVIVIEPALDVAILAGVKAAGRLKGSPVFHPRLHLAAA
ncbi:energy-coupling factor ABC transporter permease [Thiocapsa roseopersicina]|jgi:ABC-type Co2+ transport system permease subunit|uniref:ABC-type Co2+ transport system, permease component n=1 Tax=Thiocapsa roseopersicina TaxID=1058 RepID=A0A1H3DG78_THIRO|nr:energy-coupling factor ABC transporter permease [Thiocapsa roseopersicina]SDX64704.1 ABC-type Co2+ transport system, permease component [Thiocapsa roseopersicina]